jgi:hypothetical protein
MGQYVLKSKLHDKFLVKFLQIKFKKKQSLGYELHGEIYAGIRLYGN